MAEKESTQTFSFDTVAVLVATILENGGNLGAKEFKRMSALDGTRGEHGFNHMFRKVKTRAKEISEQAKGDNTLTPVKKTKAAGGSAKKNGEGASGGTSGKKRGMYSHQTSSRLLTNCASSQADQRGHACR